MYMLLPPETISYIVAQKGSGKSTLIKYLVYNLVSNKVIQKIYVFSETLNLSPDYDYIQNRSFCFDTVDPEIIAQIFTERIKLAERRQLVDSIVIIFDDVISDNKLHTSKIFCKLATQSRHLKARVIVSCQAFKCIPRTVRSQSDYLIVGYNHSEILEDLLKTEVNLPLEIQQMKKANKTKKRDYFLNYINEQTKDQYFLIYNYKQHSWSKIKALYLELKKFKVRF